MTEQSRRNKDRVNGKLTWSEREKEVKMSGVIRIERDLTNGYETEKQNDEGDEEGAERVRWGEVKHKQRADGNKEEWIEERGDKEVMTKKKQVQNHIVTYYSWHKQ